MLGRTLSHNCSVDSIEKVHSCLLKSLSIRVALTVNSLKFYVDLFLTYA